MSSEKQSSEIRYRLKAVMDLGSTSIRMVVAQVFDDGFFKTLDVLSQHVALGSDTFTKGRITRSTIEECVKVMRNFSTVLSEYGVDKKRDVRAVATSAVREARNRDEFIDRIYMATDIDVDIIEGPEVNRLTFLGIQPTLKSSPSLASGSLLVAEVGGGNTEFLGLEDGRVSFAHTYKLGSYRLREAMDAEQGSETRQMDVLEMEVNAGVRQCRETVEGQNGKHSLLLMGGEARLAARSLVADWDEQSVVQLKVTELSKLADKVLGKEVDEVARLYHITYEDALTLGITLHVYVRMAKAFGVKKVYVCAVSLRDGLMAEIALGSAWTDDFVDQILNSARAVGARFQLHEAHAECVKNNAVDVFHAMAEEHRLGYRYEVLLTVAAILHDVGMYIGMSSHHKHTQYLLENSELFGLGEEDVKLAALIARYHRRAIPRDSHPEYQALPREERLAVNKLAAILRVADALDRSHTQSIKNLKIILKGGDQMILEVDRPGAYATEKRALASKGKMFEQVYGRTVSIRAKRK